MKSYLFLFSLLLFSNYSFCCTCIGKNSIKKELKYRDVIVIGKVISQTIYEEKDSLITSLSLRKSVYQIVVIEKLKGEIKTDTISVFTGFGRGDCGVQFKIGEKYIIFANYENVHFNSGKKVENFLTTNSCTRTQQFKEKEFKKIKRRTKRKS